MIRGGYPFTRTLAAKEGINVAVPGGKASIVTPVSGSQVPTNQKIVARFQAIEGIAVTLVLLDRIPLDPGRACFHDYSAPDDSSHVA